MKSRMKQHPRSMFCNRCGVARVRLLAWHDRKRVVAAYLCARCWNHMDDARSVEDRERVRKRVPLTEARAPHNPEGTCGV